MRHRPGHREMRNARQHVDHEDKRATLKRKTDIVWSHLAHCGVNDFFVSYREIYLLKLLTFAFFCFFVAFRVDVNAQSEIETNQTTYLEFLGNSRGIWSINYDRILIKPNSSCCLLTGRMGFGTDYRTKDSSAIINLPLELSLLLGRRNSFFETGLGWTASFGKNFLDTSSKPPRHYPPFYSGWVLRIGYRYMVYKTIVLRAAPLLLFVNDPDPKLEITFGISLGYAF